MENESIIVHQKSESRECKTYGIKNKLNFGHQLLDWKGRVIYLSGYANQSIFKIGHLLGYYLKSLEPLKVSNFFMNLNTKQYNVYDP